MADLAILVKGEYRLLSEAWWDALEGPKPEIVNFVVNSRCDGCTASPDWVRGKAVWPACVVHDWHYSGTSPLGANWGARRRADSVFYRNVLKLLELQGSPAWRRYPAAFAYFRGVRRFGGATFSYEPGEEVAEASWIQRVREILGLFKAKKAQVDAA